PERRREVDGAEDAERPPAAPPRPDPLRGRRHRRPRPRPGARARHRPRTSGTEPLSADDGLGEPPARRPLAPRPEGRPAARGGGDGALSARAGTARRARRQPFRRPAETRRDRPRPDAAAEARADG